MPAKPASAAAETRSWNRTPVPRLYELSTSGWSAPRPPTSTSLLPRPDGCGFTLGRREAAGAGTFRPVEPRPRWVEGTLDRARPRWDPHVMEVIHTPDAPSHSGPVPQAVESGGWVFVSALFGTEPGTGTLPTDARAEARQMF